MSDSIAGFINQSSEIVGIEDSRQCSISSKNESEIRKAQQSPLLLNHKV